MIYLIPLLLILLVVTFLIITYKKMFNSIIVRKLRDENKSYSDFVSKGLIDDAFYKSLQKEDIELTSIDGLKLSGFFIPSKNKSKKFIILVHGISIAYIGSLKYINLFYKNNFNILVIHQRRHGKSEGMYSTYGYFEKQDLNLWINYLIDRFGKGILLGLHGESMGASTVLQAIPLNNNIKFVIEDCGYSDLYELLKYKINLEYPKILRYPLYTSLWINSFFIKSRCNFKIKDVSPIKVVSQTTVPIMFIHGNKDNFVPWYMCKDLYNAKKYGLKEILLVDDAAHAEALEKDPTLYEEEILKFIHRALKNY